MSKKKIIQIFSIAVVILIVMLLGGRLFNGSDTFQSQGPTYEVKRGPLTISFVESGTIKARDQIIIKNEVEGRTSIISLVPEGTRVQEGDLLVELDASSLQDDKIDQEIRVQNAEASYISAKESLAVIENKAQSDVDLAKLDYEFARQDRQKYIEGEYPYELDKADAEIQLAQEELTRAQQTLKWSKQLYEEKYISQTELQADEIAEKKRSLDVKLAEKSKQLLTDFTYKRDLAQLDSDVSQTQMALERTERKAKADVIQAQADLKAKEAEFMRQKDKLAKIEDQIEKTRIIAPADGLVIYATSARRGGYRSNVEPLEEGTEVREREELIYLPTANLSKAEISIHESNLEKTRLGLPAVIKVDALPGEIFYGTVRQIAPLPDAQSMWMNPDLKVYTSEIYIDGSYENLRTGMSCQAEIIVQQYSDVLYVPLQAVVRIGTVPHVYVKDDKSFVARPVQVGLDNNKMIHVTEGLREGDTVLLSPPLKAGAVHSVNGESVSDQTVNGELQEKIAARLNDIHTQPDTANEPNQRQRTPEQFENLTAEQREQMRNRFEQMTPEQREKLRQQLRESGGRQGPGRRRQNPQPQTDG